MLEKHPSYGLLRVTNVNGGKERVLFGSSIRHENTIEISLSEGAVDNSDATTYFHPGKTLFRLEMSKTQFADFLTSFGNGVGAPVTINYIRGEGYIEPCPFTNQQQRFVEEFNANLKSANEQATELIANVAAIFSKKSLTKRDREEVVTQLGKLQLAIGDSNRFILTQFEEQMNKIVAESKGEVEAFIQARINDIAADAIAQNGISRFLGIEEEAN